MLSPSDRLQSGQCSVCNRKTPTDKIVTIIGDYEDIHVPDDKAFPLCYECYRKRFGPLPFETVGKK